MAINLIRSPLQWIACSIRCRAARAGQALAAVAGHDFGEVGCLTERQTEHPAIAATGDRRSHSFEVRSKRRRRRSPRPRVDKLASNGHGWSATSVRRLRLPADGRASSAMTPLETFGDRARIRVLRSRPGCRPATTKAHCALSVSAGRSPHRFRRRHSPIGPVVDAPARTSTSPARRSRSRRLAIARRERRHVLPARLCLPCINMDADLDRLRAGAELDGQNVQRRWRATRRLPCPAPIDSRLMNRLLSARNCYYAVDGPHGTRPLTAAGCGRHGPAARHMMLKTNPAPESRRCRRPRRASATTCRWR